jgi:DNA modification methylase
MSTWQILLGDVRETLASLPDASMQTCVTSPPYWGLRDYGTAKWDGGDPACDHDQRRRENDGDSKSATSAGQTRDSVAGRTDCRKCGATRIDSQLGLEPTPDAYVANMVQVFREVRRVLRDDGTLWLNLGDSYASTPPGNTTKGVSGKSTLNGVQSDAYRETLAQSVQTKRNTIVAGLKPKDLVGIPWAVAFALRADGWYLRSEIIWAKPAPMPESVTDRCTKSHETIFMLSKQPRYYFDSQAIAEESIHAGKEVSLGAKSLSRGQQTGAGYDGHWGGAIRDSVTVANTRNKRSVWTVNTQPFSGAHFATYPEALITPCILAGSRLGDTVLDPFTGSGTTGAVAVRHQRSFIGCELNPEYLALARKRIGAVAPLLAQEVA